MLLLSIIETIKYESISIQTLKTSRFLNIRIHSRKIGTKIGGASTKEWTVDRGTDTQKSRTNSGAGPMMSFGSSHPLIIMRLNPA